jgi:ribA/ribD-fused uncharacterized protein
VTAPLVPLPAGPHRGVLLDPALCDPDLPPIDRFAGDHAFLSNFHPAPHRIPDDPADHGIEYASSEHSFNAGKDARRAVRLWVAEARTPGDAKRRGNDRTRIQLLPDWDTTARYDRMGACVSAKFRAHPGRADALLSTGRRPLVEGTTWHDNCWGDCRCGRAACAGPGQNALGDALMALRWALAHGL